MKTMLKMVNGMDQKVARASIIIPVICLLWLIINPMKIAIPQLHLYLASLPTTLILMLLFIYWLALNPRRVYCRQGGMIELCFNFIPIGLVGVLLFLESHFWAAVVLFLIWIVSEISLYFYLKHDEEKSIMVVFYRLSIFITILFFCIPYVAIAFWITLTSIF